MAQKKRLLVTASTFPRWAEDSEPRFVYDLCCALSQEFDVTALVPASPGAAEQEELGPVHVERYHYFPIHRYETLCSPGAIVPRIKEKKSRALLVPFLFASLWWNLWRRRHQFDAVHAHWLIPQGIVQSFVPMPYLVTGHGSDLSSLNFAPLRALKSRCLRRAGAVTVVSEKLRTIAQSLVPGLDCSVLPMGCDTSAFGPQYRQPNVFGSGEGPVVLFVGRLVPVKGVDVLLQAMARVNARLAIVGTGPQEQNLRQLAVVLGVRASFFGALPHEQLRVLYAPSDCLAVSSVVLSNGYADGRPTVLPEAMASGLPVVATRSGGIPDLIHDGENGLLVPPGDAEALADALNQVLNDKDLHRRLAENGLAEAKLYDYSVVGDAYAALLQQVMEEPYV